MLDVLLNAFICQKQGALNHTSSHERDKCKVAVWAQLQARWNNLQVLVSSVSPVNSSSVTSDILLPLTLNLTLIGVLTEPAFFNALLILFWSISDNTTLPVWSTLIISTGVASVSPVPGVYGNPDQDQEKELEKNKGFVQIFILIRIRISWFLFRKIRNFARKIVNLCINEWFCKPMLHFAIRLQSTLGKKH